MRNVVIVGLCILHAVIGLAIGRATAEGSVPLQPVSLPESGTAEALQGIRGELGDMRKSLVELQLRMSSRSNVDASTPADDGLDGLVSRLQELIARSSTTVENGGAGSFSSRSISKGFSSREALNASMAALQSRARIEDGAFPHDKDVARQALADAHRLWTLQELLTRYGPPDKLDPTPGYLRLRYDFPALVNGDGYADFHVTEGVVVSTGLQIF